MTLTSRPCPPLRGGVSQAQPLPHARLPFGCCHCSLGMASLVCAAPLLPQPPFLSTCCLGAGEPVAWAESHSALSWLMTQELLPSLSFSSCAGWANGSPRPCSILAFCAAELLGLVLGLLVRLLQVHALGVPSLRPLPRAPPQPADCCCALCGEHVGPPPTAYPCLDGAPVSLDRGRKEGLEEAQCSAWCRAVPTGSRETPST